MKNLLFGDTPHSNKDLHADVNDEKCKPLMYTRKNRKSYSSLHIWIQRLFTKKLLNKNAFLSHTRAVFGDPHSRVNIWF